MLLNGFLDGAILYTPDNTNYTVLPFQDTVEEVTFSVKGNMLYSRTFGQYGIKRPSAACLGSMDAEFKFSTSNLNWAFMEAATGTLDNALALPIPVVETQVLSATTGSPVHSTMTLTGTGSGTVTLVKVADAQGTQYSVTDNSGVLSFSSDLTGTRVTAWYYRDPATPTAERQLQIGGSTNRLREFGLYGRFIGCNGAYMVYANRVVLAPELDFSVGSNPAKAGFTGTCLADSAGNLAYVVKLASPVAY